MCLVFGTCTKCCNFIGWNWLCKWLIECKVITANCVTLSRISISDNNNNPSGLRRRSGPLKQSIIAPNCISLGETMVNRTFADLGVLGTSLSTCGLLTHWNCGHDGSVAANAASTPLYFYPSVIRDIRRDYCDIIHNTWHAIGAAGSQDRGNQKCDALMAAGRSVCCLLFIYSVNIWLYTERPLFKKIVTKSIRISYLLSMYA